MFGAHGSALKMLPILNKQNYTRKIGSAMQNLPHNDHNG